MSIVTPRAVAAFEAVMVKEALIGSLAGAGRRTWGAISSPTTQRVAAGALGGAGAGGVAGAGIGAAEGITSGYRQAREHGAGRLQSAGYGLASAVPTALRRGVQGVAAGAVLGGGGSAALKSLPEQLAKAPVVGSGARFGQRQLHGLTGWTPKGGIQSIRGGAYDATRRVEGAASDLRQAVKSGKGVEEAQKGLSLAQKGLDASQKAEGMGLTNLPGYARSLVERPLETLKAGFGEQWHGQGTGGKALTVGLTGLGLSSEVGGREEGQGLGQGVGRALGHTLPFVAGPLPTAAGLVASPILGAAGGVLGKGLDRLRGHRPQPQQVPA